MTHDELLAKLTDNYKLAIYAELNGEGGFLQTYKALRAVMELHKPFIGNTLELCKECSQLRKVNDPVITYPCQTIQAIEKELK